MSDLKQELITTAIIICGLLLAIGVGIAFAVSTANAEVTSNHKAGVVAELKGVKFPIQGNDRVIQGSSPKIQGN